MRPALAWHRSVLVLGVRDGALPWGWGQAHAGAVRAMETRCVEKGADESGPVGGQLRGHSGKQEGGRSEPPLSSPNAMEDLRQPSSRGQRLWLFRPGAHPCAHTCVQGLCHTCKVVIPQLGAGTAQLWPGRPLPWFERHAEGSTNPHLQLVLPPDLAHGSREAVPVP